MPLGDMFGASLATVNGQKPRNSDRIQAGQPLNLRAAFEAAQNIPVAGDAISGGMALYDAAKGDYGSAAMNALGVLPFVSGTMVNHGKLFRGLGKKFDPAVKNPVEWFSETPELANIYGKNIVTKEPAKSIDVADLGFRDYMTEVKQDNVLDRVKRAVVENFQAGKIDKNKAMSLNDKIEDMRGASNEYKRAHEFINTPEISSILKDSGYDAISHVENGHQTFGFLNGVDRNTSKLTEFEQRHLTAQRNAALPIEQGGLGLPVNNTAMQRAELLGYNTPAYHATQADVDKFKKTTKTPYGDRFFFSPDAGYASQYADVNASIAGNTEKVKAWKAKNAGDAGPNVMPVLLKDGEFKDWTHISPEYVARDPSAIRSRFAAFDPMRRHEADLLGNINPQLAGAMGVTGLGAAYGATQLPDEYKSAIANAFKGQQ